MKTLHRILTLIKRAAKWYWMAVNTPLTEEERIEAQAW